MTAFAPIFCELQAVVDLREPRVQQLLGTDDEELTEAFRQHPLSAPPTPLQQLGEYVAAYNVIDGFYYASAARPGSVCLAIFLDGLVARGSQISVFDTRNSLHVTFP